MIEGPLWNEKGFYPLRSPLPLTIELSKKLRPTLFFIIIIVIVNVVVISRLKMHFYTLILGLFDFGPSKF